MMNHQKFPRKTKIWIWIVFDLTLQYFSITYRVWNLYSISFHKLFEYTLSIHGFCDLHLDASKILYNNLLEHVQNSMICIISGVRASYEHMFVQSWFHNSNAHKTYNEYFIYRKKTSCKKSKPCLWYMSLQSGYTWSTEFFNIVNWRFTIYIIFSQFIPFESNGFLFRFESSTRPENYCI